jgi:prepilin-type N-terminal cleavage/methylation domain-containing protein
MKKRTAFTMVELIFVIVIIGILASVAIPKLTGVSDGAKKSAEIATISAVATALESAHGEWSINESDFTWGIGNNPSNELDPNGYPSDLSKNGQVFGKLIKDAKNFTKQANDSNISIYTGPASDPKNGVKFTSEKSSKDIEGKPDKNDFWVYVHGINPEDQCSINGKILYLGDISLIDVNGTSQTSYSNIHCN